MSDLKLGGPLPPCFFRRGGGVVCFTGSGGKTTSILRLARRVRESSTVIITTTTRMAVSEAETENVLLIKDYPALSSPTFLFAAKNLIEAGGVVFLFGDIAGDKYAGLSPEDISLLRCMKLASWTLVEADGASRMPIKGYAEHEPPLPDDFDYQVVLVGADALTTPMNELTSARFEILRRFLGVERNTILTGTLLLRLLTSPDMYMKNSPPGVKRILCINKTDLITPDALAPWLTYLRSNLSQYHGILTTGRNGETFYELG